MIYIATNKDNKDALMHYGVKGMRWGKRGNGRFKWPWDRDADSNNSNKNSRKSKYGTADFQRGAIGQASARDEIGRLRGASGVKRSINLYPDTAIRRSPGSNISTGARPQQNKISTSQKTSSAPDKRIKQYFRDKIDRQRAEERKQEQQRRVDARRRQQDLKKEQIEEKYWHGAINNAMHQYPYLENEYKQWKRENAGKKHTRGMAWKKDREYNNRKTYRR